MTIKWNNVALGVLLGVGIIAFICLALFLSIESYVPFHPYIDTTFSEKFSWESWEMIQQGMSRDDVHVLLGTPLGSYGGVWGYYGVKSGTDFKNLDCDTFSDDGACRWWDFAWIGMNVCYDNNGIVVGKNEIIYYN